jgi:hypothetical protein
MKNRRSTQTVVIAACTLFVLAAYAGPKDFWETKPYTEWTIKEVEKILLKNSPWTHVLLPPSSSSSVSIGGTSGGGGRGGSEGAPPIYINWYARPIREAIVRQAMLMAPNTSKADLDAVLAFTSQYYELIVTGYAPGGGSRGSRGGREGAGNSNSDMDKFKQETCLLKRNGEKIPLINLVAPPPRSRNAPYHLQFAKEIDGKPTLTLEDKEVTLVIRINDSLYRYKFKFADMMIKDKLEL